MIEINVPGAALTHNARLAARMMRLLASQVDASAARASGRLQRLPVAELMRQHAGLWTALADASDASDADGVAAALAALAEAVDEHPGLLPQRYPGLVAAAERDLAAGRR